MSVGILLITGCDRDAGQNPATRVETKFGTSTIRGVVKFIGTPPAAATIPNQPCHTGAGPLKEETVVVNGNGTLANVFVYLANAPASDGSARKTAVLDQKDCRYVPHAVAVQTGQVLRITSSDPAMHNVHYDPKQNEAANFGMTRPGAEKKVTFANAEFIRVKCDVHPWMNAYIGVFSSPFFAVSSEGEGKFEILKVPAGDYKLVAWHEQFGPIEKSVSVKENEAVDLNFEFKSP